MSNISVRVLIESLFWVGAVFCFLPLVAASMPRPSLAAQTQSLTGKSPVNSVQVTQTDTLQASTSSRLKRKASLSERWKTPVLQDWSAKRRESFLGWLTDSPKPIAVVEFPKSGGQVAVFAEESERAMTLGASYLDGVANISEDSGNVALSSHRDGPFRQLRFVNEGDLVNLYTPNGTQRFRVRQTSIVGPEEVSVLDDNGEHRLTLITCYPFYFVGSAPKRFIVEAIKLDDPVKLTPEMALCGNC